MKILVLGASGIDTLEARLEARYLNKYCGGNMKIDHFVINVDSMYQKDKEIIGQIRESGLPYEPKWGKGTKGFKASNLWIGNEYFEMIHILKEDGGGWKKDWTKMYHQGQRGLICLMLDVKCDKTRKVRV